MIMLLTEWQDQFLAFIPLKKNKHWSLFEVTKTVMQQGTQKKHCIPSTHIYYMLTTCQTQGKQLNKKICAQGTHSLVGKQCDKSYNVRVHKGHKKRITVIPTSVRD